MAKKQLAGGAEVRAFLVGQGIAVGSRGRFSAEQIEKFQEATGKVYTPKHTEPVVAKGIRVNASGRKTPVQVKTTLPEVRAWATGEGASVLADQGIQVGARGRLAPAVLSAFAARPKA